MSEEIHNWISRMKMKGNEMADEVAKRSITENIEDKEFVSTEEWNVYRINTEKRIDLKGLVKLQKKIFKIRRMERLEEPTDITKFKLGKEKD